MSTKIITCLFSSFDETRNAITELEAIGVSVQDISVVSKHPDSQAIADLGVSESSVAAVEGNDIIPQASVGALGGGFIGAMAGIGLVAIPGLGPVVAAGWLASTLVGAGVGGLGSALFGKLTSSVIHSVEHEHEDADFFLNALGETGTILTVRADATLVSQVETILQAHIPAGTSLRERDAGKFEDFQHHRNS